jgi:hypothetical protein
MCDADGGARAAFAEPGAAQSQTKCHLPTRDLPYKFPRMKARATILLTGVLILSQAGSRVLPVAPTECGGCPCQMVKCCCDERPAPPDLPPLAPVPERPDWLPAHTPTMVMVQAKARLAFRVAAVHQLPGRIRVPVYLLTCRLLI